MDVELPVRRLAEVGEEIGGVLTALPGASVQTVEERVVGEMGARVAVHGSLSTGAGSSGLVKNCM
jgi:hypothetical protein